ncbi:hypothetical protein PENARI_c018G12234 [Penicillium arizonense]|uniref:Uncharacterized protein n=1 Tax=Penicillium arizonense TaxID=1835702 RepID=A0A1F5L9Z2_PENAI|nr:hypothetical protein PENARI_c018G12234 [Penicillium arizonense]OGE50024.1 hypothetical protein PENARI_c018G12234 [Penicillium arizonense]
MYPGFITPDGLPPDSNPPSGPQYLPEFITRRHRSHPWPLRDRYDRHLPNRTAEERRETQRLEDHRSQILASMVPSSFNHLGSPGPTLPRSVRHRAANLSEGEISVLDLGPSLQPSLGTTPTPISRIRHNGGLMSENPALYTALASLATDDDGNEQRLRTDDLESEAVSSASEVSNPHPLSHRQRRQNIIIPRCSGPVNFGPRSVRQLRDSRVASSGDVQNLGHGYGYGYGYSMQDNHLYFSDESNGHIMAGSVPHSPRSPPAPLRRVLYPADYYIVLAPEQSNLRNVEQANDLTPGDSSVNPLDVDEQRRQSDTS